MHTNWKGSHPYKLTGRTRPIFAMPFLPGVIQRKMMRWMNVLYQDLVKRHNLTSHHAQQNCRPLTSTDNFFQQFLVSQILLTIPFRQLATLQSMFLHVGYQRGNRTSIAGDATSQHHQSEQQFMASTCRVHAKEKW